MKFVVVGINHELLSIDERKTYYFKESDKLAFSTCLLDEMIHQTLILSTCNRSEVYVVVEDTFDENILKDAFLSYFHQKNSPLILLSNQDALQHLLEVACGLKSMVIGEDQILHQIKEAYQWTLNQKFSGKEMNEIFQSVIQFAKEMRKKYAISEHPLSVSYIGYQKIKEYLKPNDKIMICGIGEMSQLMIEYLKDYQLYLVNRTYEHVQPYMTSSRTYVPFHQRYDYLQKVNIIITATSSPHTIFDQDKIPQDQTFLFLDLAMPRDVDPRLKHQDNITLIDMDDLQSLSQFHLQKRKDICQIIQQECYQQTQILIQKLQMMKSDELISHIQNRYLNLSEETYQLLKNKLNLNTKEDYILKKVLKTSFLRLMKEPLRLLKEEDPHKREQYIALLETIFQEEKL